MKKIMKTTARSIMCTTVVFIAIIILWWALDRFTLKYQKVPEFNNWEITVDGYAAINGSLYNEVYKGLEYGDQVTLHKVIELPEEVQWPVLRFFSRHYACEIYVNDELVFSKGNDIIENNRIVGNYYAAARIYAESGSEVDVTIKITAGNYSVKALPYVYIEDGYEVSEHYTIDTFIIMIIASIMIVIGVVIITALFSTKKIVKEYRKGIWIGIFAILIAMWTLCNYGILQVVVEDVYITYLFTEIPLFLMPIPMMLFINEYQEKDTLRKRIYTVLIASAIVFDAITIALELTGVCSMTFFVLLYQILVAVYIIYTICIIWYERKRNEDNIYMLIGVLYFGMSCLVDILRSNFSGSENVFNFTQSIVPIGAFMFFATMIIFYGTGIAKGFYRSAKEKTLMQLAYSDGLTGLANRAKCEKYASEIEYDTEHSYTVMSLDLNGLKHINDTYGHIDGDGLIIGFAEIVKSVFEDTGGGFVGRMGGDEFLVILKDKTRDETDRLIKLMNYKMEEANRAESKYLFSSAIGYAVREKGKDDKIWKLYEEADALMYECKKYQKEKLGIRVRD